MTAADKGTQTALWHDDEDKGAKGPVECLGMTFESDEARRAYFLEKLREKLADPEFRKIEGFPIGEDEDILRLSDPPYYTACPNPFMEDIVRFYGHAYDPEHDHYHREPLTRDVTRGKNDRLYRLPSYYTKVPPQAVQEYLLHYTQPGDLVLDAFCGTGMTGVACLQLGQPGPNRPRQRDEVTKWGQRCAILIDLSPAATFTASVMNAPIHPDLAAGEDGELAQWLRSEIVPLYSSHWPDDSNAFDYAVWSEWGSCSECSAVFRLYDVIVDYDGHKIRSEYRCPSCGAVQHSRSQRRAFETDYDPWLGRPVSMAKTTMVLLSRRVGNRAVRRHATEEDARRAEEVGMLPVPMVPRQLPYSHMTHQRNNLPEYWGITHIHHFYTRRNYYALARAASVPHERHRRALLFAILATLENNATRRNRFYVDGRRPAGSPIGPLSNTLYVPSLQVETNIGEKLISALSEAARVSALWPSGHSFVSTQSATNLVGIPDDSIDFIFTDPPFGGNINYSEQNLLAEWWLRVATNNGPEAITNPVQHKGLPEYQAIMTACFRECFRVLKPGRWIVVEFHNSSNAIWTAIQLALEAAGFIVATVGLLDKVQTTLHQDHKAGTVDKDLAIAAYKPGANLEGKFAVVAGTESGAWEFVSSHLTQLPVFAIKKGRPAMIPERMPHMLFDRMVAFHVQRGVTVPLSANEFYLGLAQRYHERGGMYFLTEQALEYDDKGSGLGEPEQLDLIITGEASAIQWLRVRLRSAPSTFKQLQPQFMRELASWERYDQRLELTELLEENFLRYDGRGPVPPQIHGYVCSSEKGLHGLSADHPAVIAAARDLWYVPDPNKASDLEKLRERTLLREFEEYRRGKERKLKVFRLEAVRAGFRRAWQERDYATIVEVARKIPEEVLQEDPKLLMWLNQAETRLGEA